jgi:hypothetical protein
MEMMFLLELQIKPMIPGLTLSPSFNLKSAHLPIKSQTGIKHMQGANNAEESHLIIESSI